jgi:regulator of nonsense transcripts 3
VLLGPPNLEFAPYQKVPAGKRRHDARQGTIDQDPEFMEFLESLISPPTKPATTDGTEDKEKIKVTVTPLIQHLRDKKAAKEAAKQKKDKEKAKQTGQKDTTDKKNDNENTTPAGKDGVPASSSQQKKGGRASRAEKPTKPAAKTATNKDATAADVKPQAAPRVVQAPHTAPAARSAAAQTPLTNKNASGTSANLAAASTSSTPQASVRRADNISPAAAAARMLQRDLGLRGGRGGTLGRRSGRPGQDNNQNATVTTTTPSTNATVASSAVPNAPKAIVQPVQSTATKPLTSPAIMKRQGDQPATTVPLAAAAKSVVQLPVASRPIVHPTRNVPMPQSGHGFLKHANPSQGITEALLEEVLGTFGKTVKVEIDKRKGFAYVEYTEPIALQKAIAASPIKVAQGSVQVLERKDRAPVRQIVQASQAPRVMPMAPAGRGNVVPTGPSAFRPGRGSMVGGGRGRVASVASGLQNNAGGPISVPVAPVIASATTAASTISSPVATPVASTSAPAVASADSAPVTAAAPMSSISQPLAQAQVASVKADMPAMSEAAG